MSTDISPLLTKRSNSEEAQARLDRQAWLDSQPQLFNNNDAPLVAILGDMVADPRNRGTSALAKHAAVAQLILNNNPDYYVPLGDNCYDQGMIEVYEGEYDRTFGQLKDRTIFVIGNHELTGCFNGWNTNDPTPAKVVNTVVGGNTLVLDKLPYFLEVGRNICPNPASIYTGILNPVQQTGKTPRKVTDIQQNQDGTYTITVAGLFETSPGVPVTIEAGMTAYTQNDGYGYYTYANGQCGEPYKGWHAKNFGRWRWYFLNSTSASLVAPNSEQMKWLEADLAKYPDRPIGASWHHPRWTDGLLFSRTGVPSGNVKDDDNYEFLIYTLQKTNRLQIIAVAHDHNYQRFASIRANGAVGSEMNPEGHPVPHPYGFEHFLIGCGGQNQRYSLRQPGEINGPLRRSKHEYAPNGGYGQSTNYGALFLRLGADSWSWQFRQMTGTNDAGIIVDQGEKDIFGVPTTKSEEEGGFVPIPEQPYPIAAYDWPNDPLDPRLQF